MTTNRCIPVNNVLGLSAVVSCECELLLLREAEFSVVYSLVKDAHNFDCKTRHTLTTLQMATRRKSDIEVLYRINIFFFCKLRRRYRNLTHAVKAKPSHLGNNQ